jgi:hypothetical protein
MTFYFIKKIIEGKTDELCHRQFTRFGKGQFEGRTVLNVKKSKSIKVRGSFENINDIISFLSSFNDLNVNGKIISRQPVDEIIIKAGLNIINTSLKKSAGKRIYEYDIDGILKKDYGVEIQKHSYFILLNIESPVVLKCKKKLPKPSTKAFKVDDKFFNLELPLSLTEKFTNEFLFDVNEPWKKIIIKHNYNIESIIIPKELEKEGDFEKIRLLAKKKGIIKRIMQINGKEIINEIKFEV